PDALTAALALLQQNLPTLTDSALGPAESLKQELTEARADAGTDGPGADGRSLKDRLAAGADMLAEVEKAGGALSHLGDMLKNLFDMFS
ncbi:hypothetical protein, partial [Azospirillum sp. B4]|uniref:hypothetical protein n=1 Tax=Azospirillum sp. B4 TaxID=95605 RepID=UPI0005C87420